MQARGEIARKTLVHGTRTLMTEFWLEQEAPLPSHSNLHEQTGHLVPRRMDLTIGDDALAVGAGDSWRIPGDVEHSPVARVNSVVIQVFSPLRNDYLITTSKCEPRGSSFFM